MLTPTHVRAARAALGWTAVQLAEQAGIAHTTVSRYERGETPIDKMRAGSLLKMEKAFADAGVVFGEHGIDWEVAETPLLEDPYV